jgi:hypothetical protein
VTRVIVSTWMHEHPPQMKSNTFTYLELPKVKDAGHGNWIAQMTNFKHGMKYIQATCTNPENTFVMKTRPDAYIEYDFFRSILSKSLVSKNTNIFKHKIWIPWAELTKPFYFGDELFYGHLSDLMHMYNFNTAYQQKHLGQGVTHIRRFINHFVPHYPILQEYIENKHNISRHMLVINDLEKIKTTDSYSYFVELLATYYTVLDTCFDIETQPNQIFFRKWSTPSNTTVQTQRSLVENTQALSKTCNKRMCFGNEVLLGDLKIMHSNRWVVNQNAGIFKDDVVSMDIYNCSKNLEL